MMLMNEYIIYGSRKEHFTQRVKAKNKIEAREKAEMGEWDSSDYDDEYISIDSVEVE